MGGGKLSRIVPADLSRNYIEPILNPGDTEYFYNDKNSFELFLPKEYFPKTYFRCMHGKNYDGDYNFVCPGNFMDCFKGIDALIVKPTTSLGGRGVEKYRREGEKFVNKGGEEMDLDFLNKVHKGNYLIQECFEQSDFMAQFNKSSVNTIRVVTYRDVKTGEIHVLGSLVRMGSKGAVIDNLAGGGVFVGIEKDGKFKKYVVSHSGKILTTHNDIDFSKREFVLPNYGKVKELAISVSKRMPHMSLFAHDIVLDKDNNPKLIEVNTKCFNSGILQFIQGATFGEYTDDIIEYVKGKEQKPRIIVTIEN